MTTGTSASTVPDRVTASSRSAPRRAVTRVPNSGGIAGFRRNRAIIDRMTRRLLDLRGGRRPFMAGIAIFTRASTSCGRAPGTARLIGALWDAYSVPSPKTMPPRATCPAGLSGLRAWGGVSRVNCRHSAAAPGSSRRRSPCHSA